MSTRTARGVLSDCNRPTILWWPICRYALDACPGQSGTKVKHTVSSQLISPNLMSPSFLLVVEIVFQCPLNLKKNELIIVKESCESVGRVMCIDVDWGWRRVDSDYRWH